MSLRIGIVGLPNVGKSTLFNALVCARQAEAASYPFCTIEPNEAVVGVPDPRVERLAAIVKPKKITHTAVDFVDIAGLVRGASKGEGLGNQFLGHVRETDALLHVVRCFHDEDVAHVMGEVEPARDIEIVEAELLLRDLQTVEKRVEKVRRQAQADKAVREELSVLEDLKSHLDAGTPAGDFGDSRSGASAALLSELNLLTAKKTIYCANVDEGGLAGTGAWVTAVRDYAARRDAEAVVICAEIEEELAGLDEAERREFLASYGTDESGLDRVIKTGYRVLDRVTFFTTNENEVRAWCLPRGRKAPQAAGLVHTDFERGFVRAQVIPCEEFVRRGGEAGCRAAGVMRVEGKDYVVQDGDVVLFLHSP